MIGLAGFRSYLGCAGILEFGDVLPKSGLAKTEDTTNTESAGGADEPPRCKICGPPWPDQRSHWLAGLPS